MDFGAVLSGNVDGLFNVDGFFLFFSADGLDPRVRLAYNRSLRSGGKCRSLRSTQGNNTDRNRGMCGVVVKNEGSAARKTRVRTPPKSP